MFGGLARSNEFEVDVERQHRICEQMITMLGGAGFDSWCGEAASRCCAARSRSAARRLAAARRTSSSSDSRASRSRCSSRVRAEARKLRVMPQDAVRRTCGQVGRIPR